MRDITTIDWKAPYGKNRTLNVAKQKVFYVQNGIDYDASGTACTAAQVKKYYASVAIDAQKIADDAKEASAAAQKDAESMLKAAGMTKTAARKAG